MSLLSPSGKPMALTHEHFALGVGYFCISVYVLFNLGKLYWKSD